jgi:segregation and condensation protein B
MTEPTPLRGPATTPEMDRSSRLIEALLFASPKPLSDAELRSRLPDSVALDAVLSALELAYRGRGINLVRLAGGWTFLTAPDLGDQLGLAATAARKLTRAQLETLAIIAYHQPVTRSEIEEIRGVTLSATTLELLLQTGWVEPKGRRQTVGRPTTWVTTAEFLMHFGLDSVADLPDVAELRAAGLLDARMVQPLTEAGSANVLVATDTDEEL